MATSAQRKHLRAAMLFLIAHERQVHYAQVRPMRTAHLYEEQAAELFQAGHGITMDCSEAVTLLCRWAGLQDPNGMGYGGYGFTGTLLQHLPHYPSAKDADVGALVVFGGGTGHHVGMVLEPGTDPLLFSHGSEADPRKIRLSDERKYQPPGVTFLSIAHL